MNNWSVSLYNSIKRGNDPLWNVTERIKETWRRSTRAIGGYWLGTCEYKGVRDDLLEMYLEGMMREIRETSGGLITWQGYIAEMRLTLDGITYVRSMVDLVNAAKLLYTRIGTPMLTNGGAETAAWTAFGGATTARITTWVNTGTYSCQITSGGATSGAYVEGSGYALTILANTAYEITGVVNAVTGSWRISVNRGDTGASVGFDSTRGQLGERTVKITIPATNTYAGTVNFVITSEGSAGDIVYGDSFSFAIAPFQAQTGWRLDPDSMTEYGRMELVSLEVGMTLEAARAKALTFITKMAWPKSLPPDEFTLVGNEVLGETGDKLEILCHGYVHTLANKYCITTGTGLATAQVKALIDEAEFVSRGSIDTNTLPVLIDPRGPIKCWQALMDITNAGDASGNRWVCGVYNDRRYDYGMADGLVAYRYRNGKFWNPAGGELEPWFAEPGHLLYLDDAPVGPGQISGNIEDDPHVVFVSEVEMGPATDQYPQGTLTMRHESQVI